jgi:hypothetical protein
MLFNFALQYAVKAVHKSEEGLQLSGTHHDFNALGENINITKKNSDTGLDASMEAGLDVNAEKLCRPTCLCFVTRLQGTTIVIIKVANKELKYMSQFK